MSTIMMKGSTVRKWTIMITQMIMLRSKGIDNEDKTMKKRRMINYDYLVMIVMTISEDEKDVMII
jgi:hypothetical protein